MHTPYNDQVTSARSQPKWITLQLQTLEETSIEALHWISLGNTNASFRPAAFIVQTDSHYHYLFEGFEWHTAGCAGIYCRPAGS